MLRAAATFAGAVMFLAVGCSTPHPAEVTAPAEPARTVAVAPSGPPFPRTAVCFLEHDDLPTVEALARHDVVVLDSEWDNRLPQSFFVRMRELNPDIVLLAYVNVIDQPDQLGTPGQWADRYALWQFASPTESRFPERWLARSSEGTYVSEYPSTLMANLSDRAPRVNGQTYAEYATDWIVDQVWSTGVWDGVFLDVWGDRIYGATLDEWDVDRDGVDEPASEIYGAGNPWERGVNRAERALRERLPQAVLVANADRTLRARQLDGRAWESFADPEGGRDPTYDLRGYLTTSALGSHRLPGLTLTINKEEGDPLSAEGQRRARFFLTATLLQNGYWAPMGADYGEIVHYDELDGGGLGTGYLGHPLVPNPTPEQLQAPYAEGVGQLAEDLFRRDFEHGIVLHNLSAEPRRVSLARPYQRLSGSQDPVTNDGRVVETVTLAGRDGLILLRPAS